MKIWLWKVVKIIVEKLWREDEIIGVLIGNISRVPRSLYDDIRRLHIFHIYPVTPSILLHFYRLDHLLKVQKLVRFKSVGEVFPQSFFRTYQNKFYEENSES